MAEGEKTNSIIQNLDWVVILIYLTLIFFGWINIYSAEFEPGNPGIFDFTENYGKQFIWICVSILLGIGILIVDARFYSAFAYGFYFIMLVLLVLTLLFGKEVAGARSWLEIGGFGLQASEFAKFATSLALAKFINRYEVRMTKFAHVVIGIIIFAIPAILVLLQNDTGSAMVYGVFVLVLFRQGLPAYFLYLPVAIGVLFLSTLLFNKVLVLIALVILAVLIYWLIQAQKRAALIVISGLIVASGVVYGVDYAFNNLLLPHQQERINVLLGKEVEVQGAGYNIHQSLIAIGSGGLYGKGFLQGTQTRFNFVPEQSTDFIFCTIGEEYGFVGSGITVFLFMWLIIKLILSAESQKARFPRIYGYGVASVLLFHFTINIGMTMGLFPVIGIPLPFISYGGSSLFGFTALLFIYLKLDASQKRFYH